jgi:hypothetical protein
MANRLQRSATRTEGPEFEYPKEAYDRELKRQRCKNLQRKYIQPQRVLRIKKYFFST